MLQSKNILNSLNDRQKQAVEQIDGPLLVLAGAGTGKTRVLTSRIANILYQEKAWPNEILAVTFTNKAASEMKTRIINLLNRDISDMWLGTFHSIAARILRYNAELMGLEKDFTIIDADDQVRLVKQIMETLNIDYKRYSPKTVLSFINNWKDEALLPKDVTAEMVSNYAHGRTIDIYEEYQSRLQILNAVDFGDLLMYNIIIFQNNPDILYRYQSKFKYILVDEYQDTNVAQYLWLRLLTQTHHNICCVGDDDQSIYGWRGAKVDNILRFEKDFPEAKTVRLEENYRSTGNILALASNLIANNDQRLGKTLWTQNGDGHRVVLDEYYSDKDEATKIADEIDSLKRYKGYVYSGVAILVRAGYQTRIFEDVFLRHSIDYKIIGGQRFYEYREIRDVIAYMRVLAQPRDSLALQRIINIPKRGVGDTSVKKLLDYANSNSISLFEAAEINSNDKIIGGKSATNLEYLTNQFKRWNKLREEIHYAEVVEIMLDESGYLDMWHNENSEEAKNRLDNIKELIRALKNDHQTINDFLEHVSLVMDTELTNDIPKVSLMTLHAAKGLEFPIVFLPGWNEGTFPTKRAMEEGDNNAGIEEERRLAYVGITRAKELLYISYCMNRYMYGNFDPVEPSLFIKELNENYINVRHKMNNRSFNHYNHERDLHRKSKPWFKKQQMQKAVGAEDYGDEIYDDYDNVISVDNYSLDSTSLVGKMIAHKKYGRGSVIGQNDDILKIAFKNYGIKNIKKTFVEEV